MLNNGRMKIRKRVMWTDLDARNRVEVGEPTWDAISVILELDGHGVGLKCHCRYANCAFGPVKAFQ